MGPVLTHPQRATLQKVLAQMNHVLPKIQLLTSVGAGNAALASRAAELEGRRNYLHSLATSALEFERQMAEADQGGSA